MPVGRTSMDADSAPIRQGSEDSAEGRLGTSREHAGFQVRAYTERQGSTAPFHGLPASPACCAVGWIKHHGGR